MLRAVARAEFGRRGYEATTVRDIAKAAGLSTGTVYRLDRFQRRAAGLDHAVVHRKGSLGVDERVAGRRNDQSRSSTH